MKAFSIVVMACVLQGPAALAQAPLHLEDAAYLLQTTAAAAARIELGKLAQERASDPTIRQFAADLVERYTGRLARLTELGARYGIAPIGALDPVTTWRLDRLVNLDGAAFDATYVAGEEPALYAEEWVHIRTERHATRRPIRRAAGVLADETHKSYTQALRLTVAHEDELPEGPHPDDASMILFAMNIDLAQQALGRLAIEKTQAEPIRAFAQRMIDDHGQSLDALRDLAEARGLTPLVAPGPLEALILTQLETLDGAAFDVAYLEGQVIFHDNWYKRIEYTGHNGKDEAVTAYGEAAHELGMDHHDAVYAIVRSNR